jgi:hypothetical protein
MGASRGNYELPTCSQVIKYECDSRIYAFHLVLFLLSFRCWWFCGGVVHRCNVDSVVEYFYSSLNPTRQPHQLQHRKYDDLPFLDHCQSEMPVRHTNTTALEINTR